MKTKRKICFRCLGVGVIPDQYNPESSDECDICFGKGEIYDNRGLTCFEIHADGSKELDERSDKRSD
jgi:DnaJ-class molecular chaperone